jgi:para-nitrobenzyl esterase
MVTDLLSGHLTMGRVVVAACGLMLSVVAQAADGPVVAVTGGKVQGMMLTAPGGAVFKGIPFAAPPVGDLRWHEPMPVKAWAGLRPATEFGNACEQSDRGWNKAAAAKASEDCLFLNVWTPEWPAKSKSAVMVWIHGGGNSGGSAMGAGGIEPPFDGASLARHGVVLVTIQYRLGLFGFIGHPELTAESAHHASGNYGLEDQIAALKWVHENIAKFDGDPANVTVFGQSAGAQDLSSLLTSPLAKGLITKAIIESGSPMIGDARPETEAQLEQLGVVLAGALKAPSTGAVKYMRGVPAQAILDAEAEVRKNLNGLALNVGIDGYVIPEFAPEVYREGKELAVPAIIGTNAEESNGGWVPGGMKGPTDQVTAALKVKVDALYSLYPDLLARAEKAYGVTGDMSDVSTYPIYGPFDAQFTVDLFMRCEGVALAAWHSAVAPTYRYEFTGGTAKHPPVHTSELPLLFGVLADQASDPQVSKLAEDMELYWTNLAKTGDPNGAGLPNWPKHDVKTRQYIDLGNDGPKVKANLRPVQCGIYVDKLNRDLDARKGM